MKDLIKTNTSTEIVNSSNAQHILQNQPAFKVMYDFVYDEVLVNVIRSFNHLTWAIPNDTDLEILANEVTKSIQENHKPLRTEEIAVCFAKGIRREYGEFFGLSVVSFDMFIAAYLVSDYRLKLGKTLPVAELPAPSKELTRQDRIDFALQAFEKFKANDYYNDLGNIVYTFLDSEKLIPFTPAEKFVMLEEARAAEYKRLQNPLSMEEARKFNKQIEELMESNDKIIPKSKRIALNKYFKMLKDEAKDLVFS